MVCTDDCSYFHVLSTLIWCYTFGINCISETYGCLRIATKTNISFYKCLHLNHTQTLINHSLSQAYGLVICNPFVMSSFDRTRQFSNVDSFILSWRLYEDAHLLCVVGMCEWDLFLMFTFDYDCLIWRTLLIFDSLHFDDEEWFC